MQLTKSAADSSAKKIMVIGAGFIPGRLGFWKLLVVNELKVFISLRMLKRSAQRSLFAASHVLPLCAMLALSGCLGGWGPFSQDTHYRISGVKPGQEELGSYLQAILDNRLDQDLDQSDDEQENARREAYREEKIRGDLVKALKAKGYYEGSVAYEDDGAAAFSGTYQIDPGPLYHIGSVSAEPEDFVSEGALNGLLAGDPLEAAKVLAAQAALYKATEKGHCYFTLDVSNKVVLDPQANSAAVTFAVKAGDEAQFGEVSFTGHKDVRESYLRKLQTWKPGDCFRRDRIESLRTKLLETGLFSQVEVALPDSPDADGTVPVTVELTERAPRSVEAGLSYYTDEGLGVTLGWQHRNLFGSAEELDIALAWTQIKQRLGADFSKPHFLRKDQTLNLNAALRQEDSDAFEETALELGGGITRKLSKYLSGSAGVKFLLTEIEEQGDTETFGLLSTPGTLKFDNRDDPLDPHKGWLLTGAVTPFFDTFGQSDPFVKVQGGARTYFDFGTYADLVLAARGNVGSIMGSGTFDIPASERFFAGGGGSVRGFGYQEVGPIDNNGDPTGGRSRVTGSAEARFRIKGDFGGAVFIDAGSVSESASPDFENFSIGAGAGVRYFTDFGPLRFDLAVPLNRRDELDENYQFYISIGQAF